MNMIAYCGLDCSACPAYIVSVKEDMSLRERTARQWSEIYGADIEPDDIFCTGCASAAGRKFGHCLECGIRLCAKEKGVENCAFCDEYACEKLASFLEYVPEAKETLDRLRPKG